MASGPFIIHANDHQEGILGQLLAERLQAYSAIFLRSAGMSKSDYFKYKCPRYQLISSVSDILIKRIQNWDPMRTVHLIHDGITEHEFMPPIPWPKELPRKILVIGSPAKAKGWRDCIDAFVELEQDHNE